MYKFVISSRSGWRKTVAAESLRAALQAAWPDVGTEPRPLDAKGSWAVYSVAEDAFGRVANHGRRIPARRIGYIAVVDGPSKVWREKASELPLEGWRVPAKDAGGEPYPETLG